MGWLKLFADGALTLANRGTPGGLRGRARTTAARRPPARRLDDRAGAARRAACAGRRLAGSTPRSTLSATRRSAERWMSSRASRSRWRVRDDAAHRARPDDPARRRPAVRSGRDRGERPAVHLRTDAPGARRAGANGPSARRSRGASCRHWGSHRVRHRRAGRAVRPVARHRHRGRPSGSLVGSDADAFGPAEAFSLPARCARRASIRRSRPGRGTVAG